MSRVQHDCLADAALLPLRVDAVGVLHLAAGKVLEPLVAVEAPAILPYLGDPRPDILDRRIDGHGSCCPRTGFGHELVAGERLAHFLLRCAPAQEPGTADRDVDSKSEDAGQCERSGAPPARDRPGRRSDACPGGGRQGGRAAQHDAKGAQQVDRAWLLCRRHKMEAIPQQRIHVIGEARPMLALSDRSRQGHRFRVCPQDRSAFALMWATCQTWKTDR